MKILIVTDAWEQCNGVVRSLETTIKYLEEWGHEISIIHPTLWKTFSLPGYPEIKMPIHTKGLFKRIKQFSPHVIHIATEGILGLKVRNFCVKHNISFTTAYHTRFPEYIEEHYNIPSRLTYKYMKWFHSKSQRVMVATLSLKNELELKGFSNLVMWGRGVDKELFYPRNKTLNLPSPVWMNVGRVSYEKNLEAFLDLDLPGSKVIVGDGPAKKMLEEKYPDVLFLGKKSGEELAQAYNECDVFVFPSITDTFGLVIAESLTCGKPVAAFPVTGPIDIIEQGINGYYDDDLKSACLKCLDLDTDKIIKSSEKYNWEHSSKQFFNNLFHTSVDFSKYDDND